MLGNMILHKQSQSLVKNNRFKNEYSSLGEGQNFSWGDSETDILPKQMCCVFREEQ